MRLVLRHMVHPRIHCRVGRITINYWPDDEQDWRFWRGNIWKLEIRLRP